MVYTKFADAVFDLTLKIKPEIIVPIGIDGAVIYHLLTEAYKSVDQPFVDQLGNLTEISSRANEFDMQKFEDILEKAAAEGKPVYCLDMRTKTGSLGATIRNVVKDWESKRGKKVDCKYTVLFGDKADIASKPDIMTDDERSNFFWVESMQAIQRYIRPENGKWVYDITHDQISRLNHVAKLEKLVWDRPCCG